jgi:hypothetical protein
MRLISSMSKAISPPGTDPRLGFRDAVSSAGRVLWRDRKSFRPRAKTSSVVSPDVAIFSTALREVSSENTYTSGSAFGAEPVQS